MQSKDNIKLPEPPFGPSGSRFESAMEIIIPIAKLGIEVFFLYYITTKITSMLSGNDSKENNSVFIKQLAAKLRRPELEFMVFNNHEIQILRSVVCPQDIDVSFEDIGGIEEEMEEIEENSILPIVLWNKYKNAGTAAAFSTGMLLYGNPGTGKSLTAKAIAKSELIVFRRSLLIVVLTHF
jgi:ATP-dependent 26S proteasome regulatory subunit